MTTGEVKDEDDAARLAIDVGYPVMIKVTFYILPYSFLSFMSCTVVILIFIFYLLSFYYIYNFLPLYVQSSNWHFWYTIAPISLIYVYLPYLFYSRIISSFAIRFSIINCRIWLIPICLPPFYYFFSVFFSLFILLSSFFNLFILFLSSICFTIFFTLILFYAQSLPLLLSLTLTLILSHCISIFLSVALGQCWRRWKGYEGCL